MNKYWSGRSTLATIALLSVGGFIVWIGALILIWLIWENLTGISTDFWTMTAALSTAAAVSAVIVAGYVANRELNEVASTRHMEVADKLFEELNDLENIEARRWIFQNLSGNPERALSSLTPEGRKAIKKVLNSLDRVAFLTQSGWVPEDMIMPWMNPMIVKAWIKLEPFVDYESQRRQEPDYYEHVRRLAERCLAWRATNMPDKVITWLDDAL